MTSLERVLSALSGTPPDRVPVGPFVGSAAAPLVGATLREYYTDGSVIARAQYALWREVGHDILVTAADTYYIAEAFGLKTTHHEHALPTVDAPFLSALEEADALRVPDPETDGRMPVYLKALEELRALTDGRAVLRGTGTGPFSLAAYLFGEQAFLTLLADLATGERGEEDRQRLHSLLDLMADTSAAFLSAQINRGVHLAYLGDSLASAEMISPDMYREYALPYHRKVFAAAKAHAREVGSSVFTLLHICGANLPVLSAFGETGADLIEIDHKVSLAAARERLGADVTLIGNLDPVQTLLLGTPEHVFVESQEAIREAHGAEGRFILGSGCFVPPGTPLENLRQMVAAAESLNHETHETSRKGRFLW
jgi:uroporphyrinogen decarboxylase